METQPVSERTNFLVILVTMGLVAGGLASIIFPRVAVAQSAVNVTIVNFSFNPASIVVVIGVNNSVNWTNNDYYTHTVTANDNSYMSGNIPSGGMFSHTFTVAGTFAYHCSIHNYMMGTVVVKSAVAASSSTTTTTSSTSSSSSTSTSTSSSTSIQSTSTTTSSSLSTSSTSSTSSTRTSSPVYSRPTISSTTPTTVSYQSTNPTSSYSAGGIPEFPYQAAALAVITLLILASYVAVRQTFRGRNPSP